MAPVPATLNVSWTSIYVGQHRVCWRIVGAPAYNCTDSMTHPACLGNGAPCSYDIPVTVDNETCAQVDYEGYVQPACEDEVSLNGRVPFAVSFIPDPACNRYQVICQESGVDSIVINDPGIGYSPLPTPPPAVVLSGGGGTGATADAVVGIGILTALPITFGGTGYADGVYPNVALTGGTGTLATADITIVGGIITIAVINNPGSGYTTGDILAPNTGVVGIPVAVGQLTATTDLGLITAINLTAPGSGYTSAPTVTVAASPVLTATATSLLVGCPQLTITDCDGVSIETIAAGTFQPGEDYYMCGTQAPTVPDEFAVAESGNCLCECTEYNIENTGGGPGVVFVTWIDCDDVVQTAQLAPQGGITNICAATGSVIYDDSAAGATMTLGVVGPCPGA